MLKNNYYVWIFCNFEYTNVKILKNESVEIGKWCLEWWKLGETEKMEMRNCRSVLIGKLEMVYFDLIVFLIIFWFQNMILKNI